MDESSFETFEEELGAPLREAPPPKPVRQTRRPEMYAQRRSMREDPPTSQQVPKALQREVHPSTASTIHRAFSLQNLTQIEAPWEGVTLNRCLFIAITILVISSGLQSLHEVLRGRRAVGGDMEQMEGGLSLQYTALKKHSSEPETESSLWETFLWWISDDDEDEKPQGRKRRTKQETRQSSPRGLRHRKQPERNLLKVRAGTMRNRREKRMREEEVEKVKEKRRTEEEGNEGVEQDTEEREKLKKKETKTSTKTQETQPRPKGKPAPHP
ncbi:uncharacterized protein LOC114788992 [Denticeps clupeoides]|uniref:uncharacterized protein LOC114788992 n=1 Tax=Denticeps clupeoides TaxID=299321 RepID=UPI0010A50CFC|nr:uncharacterized protein LOC114788992 [Denticeps clupeoides]